MKRRVLLALLLAACTKLDEPADPAWGKEPCAHCAMLVGDRRYAAQAIADGERRYFDDVGCMVMWSEAHTPSPARLWVRTDTGRWVDARSARYEAGARTPMDFGFATAPQGIAWDEMRDRVIAKQRSAR